MTKIHYFISRCMEIIAIFSAAIIGCVYLIGCFTTGINLIDNANPALGEKLDSATLVPLAIGEIIICAIFIMVVITTTLAITGLATSITVKLSDQITQGRITGRLSENSRTLPIGFFIYSKNSAHSQEAADFVENSPSTPRYHNAYTVCIQLTSKELKSMIRYMCQSRVYHREFPKGFPLPDHVSWIHPHISLHTARKIAKRLTTGDKIILVYKHKFPVHSQIKRTDDIVYIQANLDNDFNSC